MAAPRALILGVDGGGTKTVAAVADLAGRLVGVGRAGGSNYQSSGEAGAGAELRAAVDAALGDLSPDAIVAAAFGIAGADRANEIAIVERLVARHVPIAPRFVENDALLILRAATARGYGVGLVAGTGNNCVGRAPDGRRVQIGGMGPVSGDAGSAGDLALRAAVAAWRASDGRAPPSLLSQSVPAAARVATVEDLAGALPGDEPTVRAIVAALFAAAEQGDLAALTVLEDAATQLAEAAVAGLAALALDPPDRVAALGGAMLQLPAHARLAAAVSRRIERDAPGARAVVLDAPPVLGALLFAADLAGVTLPLAALRAQLLDRGTS